MILTNDLFFMEKHSRNNQEPMNNNWIIVWILWPKKNRRNRLKILLILTQQDMEIHSVDYTEVAKDIVCKDIIWLTLRVYLVSLHGVHLVSLYGVHLVSLYGVHFVASISYLKFDDPILDPQICIPWRILHLSGPPAP